MLFISSLILVSSSFNIKNTDDKEDIKAVIVKMFEAIKNADEKVLINCFAENAILETVYKKREETLAHRNSAKDFVSSVTKPHAEVYNEVLSSIEVKIDGEMASVWTPYKFI